MSLARIGLSVVRRPKILPVTCFRNTSTATTPDNKGTGEVSFAQQRLKDTLPPPFDATKPYKYWVSYGWCDQDIEKDRTMTHLVFFTFLTLIFGMTGMYMYYCPHRLLSDWAQREAYIRVAEREAKGLPFIDRELVPLDRIVLPTDEELGNTEIII